MTVDRRYSLALRGLPVLPADEQQRIARRYARTRDPADARRLVEGNLRLVVTIAQQMGGARRADLMDLVQEGNAGLMQAVERFDPARGVKLATYAGWWIRCFIMRHLMESSRIVRFASTREGRRRFFARALPPPDAPLDAAVGHEGGRAAANGRRIGERFAAPDDCRPDVRVEEHELIARVTAALSALGATLADERACVILRDRLASDHPARLKDLAGRFHVTPERARQLEQEVIARLRSFFCGDHAPCPQAPATVAAA
jgi:RNA polymerase sigma-32 factor